MGREPSPQASGPEETRDIYSEPISGLRFPIVGMGASAGGLEAMQMFFEHMSADSGMAFVIILHLASHFESKAAELIQPRTSMPVQQITQRTAIEPNHVYIIPPALLLTMTDGHLDLEEPGTEEERRAPVDHFLRALADAHARYAVGVILTGSGSDGAIGLKRIKEQGGGIFVQDPHEAQFNGMPRSAVATGLVDYVLPIAAMPEMLVTYMRRAAQLDEVVTGGIVDDEARLRDIMALLRVRTNHDFSLYKRPTIVRRVGRRMQVTGVSDLDTYVEVLRSRPDEVQALLQDLLISVTNFFRDREAWKALEAIVPSLFENKGPGDQIRVWVTACATGEEAYTVAMLIQEHALTLDTPPSIQIFASDIDDTAIGQARRGIYPSTIEGDVSPARLAQFFLYEQGRYRVRQELRDIVLFAHHNVLRDPPFSQLDLITCRNLLIYLNREAQEQVARLFTFSLRPGGYMLLGNSESLESVSQYFDTVVKGQRLFRQQSEMQYSQIPLLNRGQVMIPEVRDVSVDQNQASGSLDELHQRLILASGPSSVIVNGEYEIVHLSEGAGRFLQFDAGMPSTNLLRTIHPALRIEIRGALFRATHQNGRSETQRVRATLGQVERLISANIEPIQEVGWPRGYYFIRFNDIEIITEGVVIANLVPDVVMQELDAELQRTREQLQITVEAYETAGEEYKAANEELTAINEELRAATEELETSKEELQAVNEELTMVNIELKYKVDEISTTNNDLQNFIAATQIGTLFLDRDLSIMRYTPSVEAIFNLIPSDLHRPLSHVTNNLLHDRLEADARAVLANLIPTENEVETTRGSWFLMQLRPYRTNDDHIAGVVVTFVDITERKQSEVERERLLKEMEAALEVRNQFLSIASHELRTPLTPLLGYTSMLQQSMSASLNESQVKLVQTIDRQARRLNTLIGTLLDVERLQRGQFALQLQPLDLRRVVGQIVDDFRLTLPDGGGNRVVVLQQPEEALMVLGDSLRMEEVLLNLLSNAVKYSPNGGDLHVQVLRREYDAVLEVVDQGLGIPEDAKSRLFEPFYRAANAGPNISGFGLGLYIVRELVQRQNGRIELDSTTGQGTTIRVIFPLLPE